LKFPTDMCYAAIVGHSGSCKTPIYLLPSVSNLVHKIIAKTDKPTDPRGQSEVSNLRSSQYGLPAMGYEQQHSIGRRHGQLATNQSYAET